MTTTVHSPESQLNRQRAEARNLLTMLDALGIEPSDRLKDAEQQQQKLTRLVRKVQQEQATIGYDISTAAADADETALIDALTRRSTLAEAVEALNSPETLARLVATEANAVFGMATEEQPEIIEQFNHNAADFLAVYRDEFGGEQLRAATILGTPAAGHWSKLVHHAEQMNLSAAVLDTLDAVEDSEPATRYGRNLAHPWAANRAYHGPAGPSLIRASGDPVDPFTDRPGQQYRTGWEWLAAPELDTMRRWLLLATADSRPGTVAGIEYNPAAQRADDADHVALYQDWNAGKGSANHNSVASYAAEWWAQRA